MKTLLTLFLLSVLSVGAWGQCTTPGKVVWDIQPWLTQICGRAGDATFLLQGFAGVAYLSAPSIQLYGDVYINGHRVMIGEANSAGPGFRMLYIANE